jgi:hypothetical protein
MAESALPVPPKTLRMARALLALWIMDCEHSETWPTREQIDRAWNGYSQWMRDAWVERAEQVLRHVGPRST